MGLTEDDETVMARAGFGDYAIDFFYIPEELVSRLITTMREYLEEKEGDNND